MLLKKYAPIFDYPRW